MIDPCQYKAQQHCVSLVSFPPLPPGTRTFNGPPHPSTERRDGLKFVVVALLNALARLNLGSMYTCQGCGTPHGLLVASQNQHLRMYFWCVTCFFYQHFGGSIFLMIFTALSTSLMMLSKSFAAGPAIMDGPVIHFCFFLQSLYMFQTMLRRTKTYVLSTSTGRIGATTLCSSVGSRKCDPTHQPLRVLGT